MAEATRAPELDHADPAAMAFKVVSPIRPDQLDDEIRRAMKWRNGAALTIDGTAAEASPESPATMWVNHEDPNEKKVLKAIADHIPDPNWGTTPQPDDPTIPDPDLEAVLQRARAGQDLSSADVRVALLALFDDQASRSRRRGRGADQG